MTATIHTLRPHAPRPATDDTLRSDCERLMRRLVRERCASEHEMRALAEFLDHIITRAEKKA
jgi:hypothetical protein